MPPRTARPPSKRPPDDDYRSFRLGGMVMSFGSRGMVITKGGQELAWEEFLATKEGELWDYVFSLTEPPYLPLARKSIGDDAWSLAQRIESSRRHYVLTGNPLYAWSAISDLTSETHSAIVKRNGSALRKAEVALNKTCERRKCAESIATFEQTIEARRWIGDPLPDWVLKFLRSAAEALLSFSTEDGSYARGIVQSLGLTSPGGGPSAHARYNGDSAPIDRARARLAVEKAGSLNLRMTPRLLSSILWISPARAKELLKETRQSITSQNCKIAI